MARNSHEWAHQPWMVSASTLHGGASPTPERSEPAEPFLRACLVCPVWMKPCPWWCPQGSEARLGLEAIGADPRWEGGGALETVSLRRCAGRTAGRAGRWSHLRRELQPVMTGRQAPRLTSAGSQGDWRDGNQARERRRGRRRPGMRPHGGQQGRPQPSGLPATGWTREKPG